MNWKTIAIATLLGGLVHGLGGFVLHGLVMGDTYRGLPEVFEQQDSNPAFMFLVSVAIVFFAALLFAQTRQCWAAGLRGGVNFGLLAGALVGFVSFYWPMVFAGFPYYLAWCWLGVDLITYALSGAVLGALIKRA